MRISRSVAAAAAAVFVHQLLVGKLSLWILVEPPHEAVGGGIGEVEVVVLEVFAVVALGVAQAEGPLLKDGIGAIPEGQGETQPTLLIADAQQPVFSPAIHPRAGLIMGKGAPGIAIGGVVLPHRAPLAIG
jgi:hypothetical protein